MIALPSSVSGTAAYTKAIFQAGPTRRGEPYEAEALGEQLFQFAAHHAGFPGCLVSTEQSASGN